jgi:hypothetical protein
LPVISPSPLRDVGASLAVQIRYRSGSGKDHYARDQKGDRDPDQDQLNTRTAQRVDPLWGFASPPLTADAPAKQTLIMIRP